MLRKPNVIKEGLMCRYCIYIKKHMYKKQFTCTLKDEIVPAMGTVCEEFKNRKDQDRRLTLYKCNNCGKVLEVDYNTERIVHWECCKTIACKNSFSCDGCSAIAQRIGLKEDLL